jgi:hypothetical protein
MDQVYQYFELLVHVHDIYIGQCINIMVILSRPGRSETVDYTSNNQMYTKKKVLG